MSLPGRVEQPEKVAVGEENQYEAALRVGDVDGAPAVHGDSRSVPETKILE
jgi:hypothetical protein